MQAQNQQLVKIQHNLNRLIKIKASAFPEGFNQTRFIQNCMSILMDTPDIHLVTPESVARCMLKGAFLGLDFMNKECYPIPYNKNIAPKGSKPKYIKELQFQTDYKGEKKIAKKYSLRPIKEIYAKVVREGDSFEETIVGGQPSINFVPKSFNQGAVSGFFAVCLYDDGGLIYETMTLKEVEHVRDTYSKMPKGQAWLNRPEEMGKKTVLRLLCKGIEIEFPNLDATLAFEAGADAEFADFEDVTEEPIQMPAETSNNGKEGDQLRQMLVLLHPGDDAGEWLELSTTFTDKATKKLITGKRDLDKLTEKQRPFVFRKLKDELQGKADLMAVELYPEKDEREKALAGMADGVIDIEEMKTAAQIQTYEILFNLKLDKEAKATEAK